MTVDDYLPWYGGSPAFAKRSNDGDFWMSILEKTFAKMMGNYEAIGGGWQAETWRILNGAPTQFYTMQSINYNSITAFNTIVNALKNGFMVGTDTSTNPPYGLVEGHAYSVVGAYNLRDSNGAIAHILLRIRNPWGQDRYNGPWSDGDTSRWTSSFKS